MKTGVYRALDGTGGGVTLDGSEEGQSQGKQRYNGSDGGQDQDRNSNCRSYSPFFVRVDFIRNFFGKVCSQVSNGCIGLSESRRYGFFDFAEFPANPCFGLGYFNANIVHFGVNMIFCRQFLGRGILFGILRHVLDLFGRLLFFFCTRWGGFAIPIRGFALPACLRRANGIRGRLQGHKGYVAGGRKRPPLPIRCD